MTIACAVAAAGGPDECWSTGSEKQLIALVADAAGNPSLARRIWVLLTEATPGGWVPMGVEMGVRASYESPSGSPGGAVSCVEWW